MPSDLFLCLGSSHKRKRNKKISKLVKVHTDETTSIKLSSAGSSVLSFRSFVPSVSLNLKNPPTPPRKDSINEGLADNLIEKQTLPLISNTDEEIDTTPKKVCPANEDPISNEDYLANKDHPVIKENPSIEDKPSIEDQSSNGDNPSDKNHSPDKDKKLMEDHNFDEYHTPNEDFSTKDPPLCEEHLPTESSMSASLESSSSVGSSSVENEYARLVCSAAQNSFSEEKQNELLNGVNSNESYMSLLIESMENLSTSSKTTLASPTKFISAEDVKISGVHSPSEFAEVLLLSRSVKEERAEMIEVTWKSPVIVKPVKIEPVEIVEHDNSADYLELEYDAWVPGQPVDDLNILDLNECEEFIEELEFEDKSIFNDDRNETAAYLELDDDAYVPGQPTDELKILLTRYDELNEKIKPGYKTSNTDVCDKTVAYHELEDDTCLPGTPTEDLKILLSGYEELNERIKPVNDTSCNDAYDGNAAHLEVEDDTCIPNQPTHDLKILLAECEELYKKFELEDEASNDNFQNESDFGQLKPSTTKIPRGSFEVAFDSNLSAGDSIPSTTDIQCQTNENFDQHDSSKIEGFELSFKEDIEAISKTLTEDCDYAELENPVDWCGDFACYVFESENDKKSVSSDRSETEMAEINDLLWSNEEMTTEIPISRISQLRISERQRKFRNTLQNLIDAQSSPEFQSVYNVNVFREELTGGDSDSVENKMFCSKVNDSIDAQFSLEENPNSDGRFQSQNDNQDAEMQSHSFLNAQIMKENEKRGIIKETKSCDQIVSEMVETNKISRGDEEITDESSQAENAHKIVSKWRKRFRTNLNKLIEMKNAAQNQSTSNSNVSTEVTNRETDSDNKNVKNSNDKQNSPKEDINSEGNYCSQYDNPITEKHSHSILNEEALQLLEESKKKDKTDSSLESDLNDDTDCFKFKRARISETRNKSATPKRKVIDQVIESTQKFFTPNYNTDKDTQNHKRSESSKGNGDNQDSLHSMFQDQISDSFSYSNFISQNKLKNEIESFIKKAEEYNQMLSNGQITVSNVKDFADKITQMDIDQTTPRNRNTCADKLIKQFMNKQDGIKHCDLQENSKTGDVQAEQTDGTDKILLDFYTVDALDSPLKENVNYNNGKVSKSYGVSCSPFSITFDPNEQEGFIEQTTEDASISLKSSNNAFTLNLNHKNGKKSFECSGDFVLSRGDNDDHSSAPNPLTIHLTSKSNRTKNRHSPSKPSADSKSKSSDIKYQNLDPKVMAQHKKSQEVFDHFMKEALEPLGTNRRILPIKRTGSLPFTSFTFSSLENEMTNAFEKSGNGSKLHARVPSAHSRTSKGKHGRHSPNTVNSPTSFRTYRRHNNTDSLFGEERTSIAKRFLEASNAFKYWRSSLDGYQGLDPSDHAKQDVLKTTDGFSGQRLNNPKMKHLEMIHKRFDDMKSKRDVEKIEGIKKFVDNSQFKLTKGNVSDCFGEVFNGQFKRYARKGNSSGDRISHQLSTEWLTDAGIVGTLLTADEANKIFKRIAGVKVTLNKQDYKRFLYKLTRVKRITYNEIYERLCRC